MIDADYLPQIQNTFSLNNWNQTISTLQPLPVGAWKVLFEMTQLMMGFPGGSVVKNLPADAGEMGSVSEVGRCPGKGNGYPPQYPCLRNPMDRGA